MKDKYYTPEIEEFHVGFECEWKMQESNFLTYPNDMWVYSWNKHIITLDDFSDHDLASNFHNITYNLNEWRVRYLDKQDIEDCGFTKECSKYSKILDTSCDIYKSEEKNLILSYYPSIKKITIATRDYSKNNITIKGTWDDKQINLITVKNKSELQRILKQIE